MNSTRILVLVLSPAAISHLVVEQPSDGTCLYAAGLTRLNNELVCVIDWDCVSTNTQLIAGITTVLRGCTIQDQFPTTITIPFTQTFSGETTTGSAFLTSLGFELDTAAPLENAMDSAADIACVDFMLGAFVLVIILAVCIVLAS